MKFLLSLASLTLIFCAGVIFHNRSAQSQTNSCRDLFEEYYNNTFDTPYSGEFAVGKVIVQRGADWTGWAEFSIVRDSETQSVRGEFDTIYSSRSYSSDRGGGPFNVDWPSNTLLSLNRDGTITYIEKYEQNGETSFTINPRCSNSFSQGEFVIRGMKSAIIVSPIVYRFAPH